MKTGLVVGANLVLFFLCTISDFVSNSIFFRHVGVCIKLMSFKIKGNMSCPFDVCWHHLILVMVGRTSSFMFGMLVFRKLWGYTA